MVFFICEGEHFWKLLNRLGFKIISWGCMCVFIWVFYLFGWLVGCFFVGDVFRQIGKQRGDIWGKEIGVEKCAAFKYSCKHEGHNPCLDMEGLEEISD